MLSIDLSCESFLDMIGTKRMYLRFAFELISPKFEEGVGGVANIGGF